jgi:uncharacterized membrane protein YhdT
VVARLFSFSLTKKLLPIFKALLSLPSSFNASCQASPVCFIVTRGLLLPPKARAKTICFCGQPDPTRASYIPSPALVFHGTRFESRSWQQLSWYEFLCKIVHLDFIHVCNYIITKLRLRRWILLSSSGGQIRFLSSFPLSYLKKAEPIFRNVTVYNFRQWTKSTTTLIMSSRAISCVILFLTWKHHIIQNNSSIQYSSRSSETFKLRRIFIIPLSL